MKTEKLHEECAVFGVNIKTGEAAGEIYNALLSLQHRGQEGTGIAVLSENGIHCHKDLGLVSDVFSPELLSSFPQSGAGIGHNRYSTTGNNTISNVQPFVTEYLTGRIATAHNGNITNARDIREGLVSFGVHFEASSDTEVVSALIAYYTVTLGDVVRGIKKAAGMLEGAFSLVVLCSDGRVIALRDPMGYRPLCVGENEQGVAVASESCALDACGFSFLFDVAPGELIILENGAVTRREQALPPGKGEGGLCIFEYVYFARTDSVIDNLSVYDARFRMGQILAREHPVAADLVCGVPDSGLEAAAGYAAEGGLPLKPGFVKNPYVGRSFIYPTQQQRENAVRLKLNPLRSNVAGKKSFWWMIPSCGAPPAPRS